MRSVRSHRYRVECWSAGRAPRPSAPRAGLFAVATLRCAASHRAAGSLVPRASSLRALLAQPCGGLSLPSLTRNTACDPSGVVVAWGLSSNGCDPSGVRLMPYLGNTPRRTLRHRGQAFDPGGVAAICTRSTKEVFDPEGVAGGSPGQGVPFQFVRRIPVRQRSPAPHKLRNADPP